METREVQIGDLVLFVLGNGDVRPAIVVNKWSAETVNLQVLTDSDSEGKYNDKLPPVMWATSVLYNADKVSPYSWHWKE